MLNFPRAQDGLEHSCSTFVLSPAFESDFPGVRRLAQPPPAHSPFSFRCFPKLSHLTVVSASDVKGSVGSQGKWSQELEVPGAPEETVPIGTPNHVCWTSLTPPNCTLRRLWLASL